MDVLAPVLLDTPLYTPQYFPILLDTLLGTVILPDDFEVPDVDELVHLRYVVSVVAAVVLADVKLPNVLELL